MLSGHAGGSWAELERRGIRVGLSSYLQIHLKFQANLQRCAYFSAGLVVAVGDGELSMVISLPGELV